MDKKSSTYKGDENMEAWKRIYDTITSLLENIENTGDNSLNKLFQSIGSLKSVFILQYNPYNGRAAYESLQKDYYTFTLWIIGRLFYMLTLEKTKELYSGTIIDLQISILNELLNHQPTHYDNIITEYMSAFEQLKKCITAESNEQNIVLTAFVPPDNSFNMKLTPVTVNITSHEECFALQTYLLKMIEFSLINDFIMHNITDKTTTNLGNMVFLILNGASLVKFAVLETLCTLTERFSFFDGNYSIHLLKLVDKLVSVQENIAYEYFKVINLSLDEFKIYEHFLTLILSNLHRESRYVRQFERLSKFIIAKSMLRNSSDGDIYHKGNSNLLSMANAALEFTTRNASETFELYVDYAKVCLKTKNTVLLPLLESKIIKEVKENIALSNSVDDVFNTSKIWIEFHHFVLHLEESQNFKEQISFIKDILEMGIRLKIDILSYLREESRIDCNNLFLFEGFALIRILFKFIVNSPNSIFDLNIFAGVLVNVSMLSSMTNDDLDMVLQIVSYAIAKTLSKNYYDDVVCSFYNILKRSDLSVEISLRNLKRMLQFNAMFHNASFEAAAPTIFACLVKSFKEFDTKCKCETINCLPYLFVHMKQNHQKIMCAMLSNAKNETDVKESLSFVLPSILCLMDSRCFLSMSYVRGGCVAPELNFQFDCLKCSDLVDDESSNVQNSEDRLKRFKSAMTSDNKCFLISENVLSIAGIDKSQIETCAEHLFRAPNNEIGIKSNLISNLLVYLKHIPHFHAQRFTVLWLPFIQDYSKEVRDEFCQVLYNVLQYTQNSPCVSTENKNDIFTLTISKMREALKFSLRNRDFELQENLLKTCEKIGTLNKEDIILPTTLILIHFIMIPCTSPQLSLLAIDSLMHISTAHKTTPYLIYIQYKKEILKTIAGLAIFNHKVFQLNLDNSLGNLSLAFGMFGVKDLFYNDCHHILPFFVSSVVRDPTIARLVEEIAQIMDTTVDDLFSSKYYNIYPHILLYETDIFNETMEYLQKMTGTHHAVLKKKLFNFQTIINELLLNFHDRQEQVISGLKLIVVEDPELANSCTLVQLNEHLQPRYLGVLVYFDSKLVSSSTADSVKKQVIMSLSGILSFMGSKYITPIRFKVLATLRTALLLTHSNFPQLNCQAWRSFVHSCDIDSIGPQLASIFISLLTLANNFPQEIGDIFDYLVIQNELALREHIPDLFFTANIANVPNRIKAVITRNLDALDMNVFSKKLEWLLKYLEHETIELRIHGLQFMKALLEANRDDLDRMILGYNGIDPLIVRLLDILTATCREKNSRLRLACGECIGALGAIEPSHLPRRCAESAQPFTYFMDDDIFIFNAINELMRALQVEQHTTNVDRFSFAIQEILKKYNLSPDVSSVRNYLWKKFSESQTEIMIPLLSSRYAMGIPMETVTVCPVYQSNIGANFNGWIYNWTAQLITFLEEDRRSFLEKCYPSLKQDQKMLTQFLPYILLHALLEGVEEQVNSIYLELQAVIKSTDKKPKLDETALRKRLISTAAVAENSEGSDTDPRTTQEKCIKTVFILLDFLDRWLTEWKWDQNKKQSDKQYLQVQKFLNAFSELELAQCSYACGEYLRALVYLERHLAAKAEVQKDHLSFLSEIYALLNEADAVYGVEALQQTEPSLEQRILVHEVAGKLADAAACYEKMPLPLKQSHVQGLIQCYIDLDNVNSALNFARGALEKQSEYKEVLLQAQAEPLWRLGRFDDLKELLGRPEMSDSTNWGVLIGRAFVHFRENTTEFNNVLKVLCTQQVELFGAASLEQGIYQDGYAYIARLHALKELQEVQQVTERILNTSDVSKAERELEKLTTEWELRLKVVQDSIRIIEPILCLRRVGLLQVKHLLQEKSKAAADATSDLLNVALGNLWLKSANLAREAGMHQQAYTYTLRAEEYNPVQLFLEKAKLHWMREEREAALTTLNRGVEKFLLKNNAPSGPTTSSTSNSQKWAHLSLENRKICAEAKLLIAKYNDATSNVDAEVNLNYYREAVEVLGECEKSLVCLAQYYDRVFSNFVDNERDTVGSDVQVYMINYFGKSLQYGAESIYQSMPRLLSIWFDYGTRAMDTTAPTSLKQTRREALLKMTHLIDTFLDRLPAYIFLSAFSQIMSRICHPNNEVHLQLKTIIIKLIQQYPQQTMWMMVSVLKSSYTVRSKRCTEILNDPRLKSSANMNKFIGDFTMLADKLIELCNKPISDNVQSTSVTSLVRTLPKLLADKKFSNIIVPVERFRKLVLPNPDLKSSQHNPFQNQYVYIAGIDDVVTVLPSLQKPRKISLRGSDGKKYIHMLKPKDDLRRDFRLMEFNMVVNHLLMRDGESRQRRLCIRTYSVAPLNEECGLIEWVNNLVGLRPILVGIYKHRGIHTAVRDLKSLICNNRDPLHVKRDTFLKKLLPRHPPVLGTWFQKTFPDAQGWLSARIAYTRTTAVMSMVGYMLGLGDRHGENILFDSTNGDTVHVDFNCLFNKGEQFDWPERVPFRLTHNMVHAMGPLGVDGIYRKSCVVTLKVLRSHADTLMSIVTPFVYDPLVSWTRNPQARRDANNSEMTNEQAVEHVQNIKLRLQGIAHRRNKSYSIPLSIEGQANNLILEATSVDNLCRMYVGWGSFM